MTVAAFMELALYDPVAGYYARAAQRSGRAGDFFTSVDVGPVFGQMLAEQFAEMARLLALQRHRPAPAAFPAPEVDLVEAAAGNGRLSLDVMNALETRHPELYSRTRLHLVERSDNARRGQSATLAAHMRRVASSSTQLPDEFEGVLFANELLDAMPVHQVVMRESGLKEVYVTSSLRGLTTIEDEPSTPALTAYFNDAGILLEPGWRAEINLAGAAWMREAARRIRRGFIVLFDYGHDARELYSVTHASGTLTSFSSHTSAGPEASRPLWLERPGKQDITAHVDFSTIRRVAREEGLETLAFLDQTYFVLGILTQLSNENPGNRANPVNPLNRSIKTLLMPGGLGSTMKVLILGKDVGLPRLMACSFSTRVT